MNLVSKHLFFALLLPWCVLVVPAAAMLLRVDGWAWTPSDFVVAWALLAFAVLAYRAATTLVHTAGVDHRIAAALAVATALALIWVNGAVGLIGSEGNPANLLYAGVLLVGMIGAVAARFRPAGMVRTMLATALAQALVPALAWLIWPGDFSPGVPEVFALNGGFVAMFLASAFFYRRASAHTAEAW
ncbi:hypothetical protein ASA1KI_28140 [Opitutales bacterium ASA1]|uniref:hypothetical protein n=1 Tax=Congregicoccus parvus TaxID=3081749 RepID=UPI002B2BE5BF|nr:hypothetical protein ASA1KI_28140 [Opitutales bacterium ASA1]